MKKLAWIVGVIVGLVALFAVALVLVWRSPLWRERLLQKTVSTVTRSTSDAQTALLHRALGFDKPRTYLLLFLNNTEMRPGGGFIGSYGVVRVSNGVPEILIVSGTETLDLSSPQAGLTPPAILTKYLKIKVWQFRDSNWSPDFVSSTKLGLQMYALEKGASAGQIDGVIAFDPTIVENILAISGPVTVNGLQFTSANFTRELENEVEFAYRDRGLDFRERKKIIHEIAVVLLRRIVTDSFLHFNAYMALVPRMLEQKHVVLYSLHADEQAKIAEQGWDGAMRTSTADYLLWADANLGALKTDASINRSLHYVFAPSGQNFVATATMKYVHFGKFDKFTSRYRDYARIYVPVGSTLLAVNGMPLKKYRAEPIDQGVENGRQWFGTTISVDPGTTKSLSFSYTVSPQVVAQIRLGQYNLLVQKQIGTHEPPLTLGLDFGTTLLGARPGEGASRHGDTRYDVETSLITDQEFHVTLTR